MDDTRTEDVPEPEPVRPTDPGDSDWPPYARPRSPRQVGIILGVVFVTVGIAVVVVYQQGHDKPVMTRRMVEPLEPPPPVVAAFPGLRACPAHAGGTCPGGAGGAMAGGGTCPGAAGGNCPGGQAGLGGGGGACPGGVGCPGAGGAPPQPVAWTAATPAARPPTAQPAVCPRCGGLALPVCDRCNAVMLPVRQGLFYCARCGAVGTPPCPYCGGRMTTGTLTPTMPAPPPGAGWQ
jgi:hypothetical protein